MKNVLRLKMNAELDYLVSAIKDIQLCKKQDSIYREHMANNYSALKDLDTNSAAVNNLQKRLKEKQLEIKEKQEKLINLQQMILAKLSEEVDIGMGDPSEYVPMAATLNAIIDKLYSVTESCTDKLTSGVPVSEIIELADDSNAIIDKLAGETIIDETRDEQDRRHNAVMEMQNTYLEKMIKATEGLDEHNDEEDCMESV